MEALLYTGIYGGIKYARDDEDGAINTIAAGALTGLLFKSTGNNNITY